MNEIDNSKSRIKVQHEGESLIIYDGNVGLGRGDLLAVRPDGVILGSTTTAIPMKTLVSTTETKIYVDPLGNDVTGNGTTIAPFATIGKAMLMATTVRNTILCAPGEYAEDVTWSDVNGISLLSQIHNTVTVAAVTTFAISINPAASSGTWSATIGVNISHADTLTGIQVNNATVAKRINLYLEHVNIESQTATDHAIDVNRGGGAGDSIRIYANGCGERIEGLVDYISESTDDRIRFWGYRLMGGITVTGAVVNEIVFMNCGILTGGESFDGANVSSHFGCYYESDANPNVHTVCADDDDTT